MTRVPPLPKGNRSPYPIAEPPHAAAPPSSPTKAKSHTTKEKDARLVAAIAAGATAALSAIGVGVYLLLNRSAADEPAPKTRARKPAARKPRATTARKAKAASTSPARKETRARKPEGDKAVRRTRDRKLIAMKEEHEVAYWTKKFGVDRAALQAAVDEVGNSATAVAEHLRSVNPLV